MVRLFDEHQIRKTALLSGAWKFITDPEKIGLEQGWQKDFPSKTDTVIVPSCWNNEFGYYEYTGVAWYSRKVVTSAPALKLVFDAVMTEAVVFWDGQQVAEHYGGFTAFTALLENVVPGEHTLTVRVDNSFDLDSIPQKRVDWYHYGGITRDVEIEEMKGIMIMSQYMTYDLSEDLKNADVKYHVTLRNFASDVRTRPLCIKMNGEEVCAEEITLQAGEEKEVVLNAAMQNIRLWSAEHPELYWLSYSTEDDDLIDRTGFRKIEVKDRQIFINGRKTVFHGVCRHEDNADFGFAFPRKMMLRDIAILKNMNCNAVRGSHYPNSQSFVDYMDEYGINFWSEIPIWGCGFAVETLAREKVLSRGLTMHREMLAQYRNHPCIMLWGLHNEIRSDTENGKAMSKLYYEEIKRLDNSRLVTYASNHILEDISLDYCDVVSVNEYLGWYSGGIENWKQFVEDMKQYLEKTGNGHKPILMSEFGAAALYGNNTFEDIRWTEEYQARLIRETLQLFLNEPAMSGTFIWQFCDGRTALDLDLNRARSFNNKGLMNEYRKPKMAYYVAKEIYGSKK